MNNNPTNLTDPGGGCPECPHPSETGIQMSFATDGPHAGTVYELMDPSLGRDGWVRIDNAMLDGVTITPSLTHKVNDFGVGILNPRWSTVSCPTHYTSMRHIT